MGNKHNKCEGWGIWKVEIKSYCIVASMYVSGAANDSFKIILFIRRVINLLFTLAFGIFWSPDHEIRNLKVNKSTQVINSPMPRVLIYNYLKIESSLVILPLLRQLCYIYCFIFFLMVVKRAFHPYVQLYLKKSKPLQWISLQLCGEWEDQY